VLSFNITVSCMGERGDERSESCTAVSNCLRKSVLRGDFCAETRLELFIVVGRFFHFFLLSCVCKKTSHGWGERHFSRLINLLLKELGRLGE